MTTAGHHPPIVGSPLRLTWRSEDDARALAQRLAASPLIADAFIELRGDLGAGKTTWVRLLLRALGVSGRIKSPTYAVVEPHEAPAQGDRAALPIWHFDFYRFTDPREWEDAGLRDLFARPGLKLAEWPEQAGPCLPTPDLVLAIEAPTETQREVTVTAHTPRGQGLLER